MKVLECPGLRHTRSNQIPNKYKTCNTCAPAVKQIFQAVAITFALIVVCRTIICLMVYTQIRYKEKSVVY